MAELSDLTKLLCGGAAVDEADPDCEISQILIHLKAVLNATLTEMQGLGKASDNSITIYGPFLVRSLLEVGVTALIGRIDPTRLIVVKRIQQHSEYDIKRPWQAAIHWGSDVVDEKVKDLWSSDKKYKDMTKALLGDYYVEIYWTLALKKLADLSVAGGAWLAQIKGKGIAEFSHSRRDAIKNIYSESSKGVHSEFVIPSGSRYDKLTITNLITRIMQILSELGLLINLLPHIAYKLEPADAVNLFNGIEGIEVMK